MTIDETLALESLKRYDPEEYKRRRSLKSTRYLDYDPMRAPMKPLPTKNEISRAWDVSAKNSSNGLDHAMHTMKLADKHHKRKVDRYRQDEDDRALNYMHGKVRSILTATHDPYSDNRLFKPSKEAAIYNLAKNIYNKYEISEDEAFEMAYEFMDGQ